MAEDDEDDRQDDAQDNGSDNEHDDESEDLEPGDAFSGPHVDESTTKQTMSSTKFSTRERENTTMAAIDQERQERQADDEDDADEDEE